jgi:hypothetical protein
MRGPFLLVQGMAFPTDFETYVASPQGSSKGYGGSWGTSCERPERDFGTLGRFLLVLIQGCHTRHFGTLGGQVLSSDRKSNSMVSRV